MHLKIGSYGCEVSCLDKSINNNPNGVISFLRSRYPSDKIYSYTIPLPFRNFQRSKLSRGPLMLSLDHLTCRSFLYKHNDIRFHSILIILSLQIVIYLYTSGVYGKLGTMSLMYNSFSQHRVRSYYKLTLKKEESICAQLP